MTNVSNIIEPNRPEESDEGKKRARSVDRPEAESVSPSQQGKFLSALEGKQKPVKKEGEEKEVPKGLFQVIKPKEGEGEPSSEGDENPSEGEGFEPPPKPMQALQPPLGVGHEPSAKEVGPAFKDAERKVEVPKGFFSERAKRVEPEPKTEKVTRKKDEPIRPREAIVGAPILSIGDERKMIDTHIQDEKAIRETLHALVKECAAAIDTLVSKTATTTVVNLKYPPLFEGASLTITEFAQAKKEFNITFANLSPDARRLIEATANQEQLRQNLVDKGYAVHMIAIEAPQKPITTAGAETQAETRGRKGEAEARQGTEAESGMDLV